MDYLLILLKKIKKNKIKIKIKITKIIFDYYVFFSDDLLNHH